MIWLTLLDRRRFVFVLIAAWALAYLPNLGTRTLRLEEGRRATPAREMLASDDFVRPTLYGETYLSKPPLFYWIVAVVGSILGGVSPLAVRIPSVLAALGCALVAWRFAPQSLDRTTRSLAALFVLASAAMLEKGTLGEIDATLCLFVAGALKFWWDGNRLEGQTTGSWVLTGTMLGISVLLKGPAGPAIFYLTVGPYLVWVGRWRRLFTIGHFGCLALAALPPVAWVVALLERGVISAADLLVVWRVQLGGDYAAASLSDPGGQTDRLVEHYVSFPLPLIGLLLPAVLWLPFALSRTWSTTRGVPDDLRRFLACGVLAPCAVFYLYPESRPRHLLAVFFPTAILAAMVVAAVVRHPDRWAARSRILGSVLEYVPTLILAAGAAFAFFVCPPGIAVIVLVIGAAWQLVDTRLMQKTPSEAGSVTLAISVVRIPLAAWFIFNAVVVPWKAPTNSARGAQELSGRLPPGEVVYTMRTFPTKGDRYFNLQFHLSNNLRAANDLEIIKQAAPCLAVVTPEERAELESAGWTVEEIGTMGGTPGAPPVVHVIRVQALPPISAGG